jgi:hypothetical protein
VKTAIRLAFAAASATLLLAAPASAGTLDQQQTSSGSVFNQVKATFTLGQTFEAGLTGGVDQVDLWLAKDANAPTQPLTVQIRDVVSGTPGAQVLATASVPVTALAAIPGGFIAVPFAAPAPVTAGSDYSIVLSSTTPNPGRWLWSSATYDVNNDTYAAGAPFSAIPPGPFTPYADTGDFNFKTYVGPLPPPAGPIGPIISGGSTGLRAAALKKCKKKHSHHARKKCKKKARLLPV